MEWYIINMPKKGLKGVGVRREEGGSREVRRGGRGGGESKLTTPGGPKLLTCGLWTASAIPPPPPPRGEPENPCLARSCKELCQAPLWPGLGDKRQWGAELLTWHPLPLQRSLIKYETDDVYMASWRCAGKRGSRARGGCTERGTRPPETHTGRLRTANCSSEAASLCLLSTQNVFFRISITSSFSGSDTK